MERTISGMMGKGAINHNTRAFNAKNFDYPEKPLKYKHIRRISD